MNDRERPWGEVVNPRIVIDRKYKTYGIYYDVEMCIKMEKSNIYIDIKIKKNVLFIFCSYTITLAEMKWSFTGNLPHMIVQLEVIFYSESAAIAFWLGNLFVNFVLIS